MILAIVMVIGYAIIGFCVGRDLLRVHRRCRVELRQCFGRRMVYLRDRKTGRLIGCSNNPFTLILQVA